MDEKLKPCPFCTSTVLMTLPPTCTAKSPYNPADRLYPVVRCMDCWAEVSGDNGDRTSRTAEEKWNRRPGEDTARAAGYAAGIADAEKVALDYTAREDDYPSAVARDFYESAVVDAVSDIAESIRALSTSKGE